MFPYICPLVAALGNVARPLGFVSGGGEGYRHTLVTVRVACDLLVFVACNEFGLDSHESSMVGMGVVELDCRVRSLRVSLTASIRAVRACIVL